MQSCKQSYSANATKLPSFDRSFQAELLQSRKPPSQTPKSSMDKHTSSIHGSRQLKPSYESMATQLETPQPNSTTSTSTLTPMFKLWCFPSSPKSTSHRTTIIPSSTSFSAFTTIQTRYKKQRISYMLSSRAPTLFTHIWPSLNALSTKPMVKTGQTSTISLRSVMVSILHYAIGLLSNSTFLASTPVLYELSNN